MYLVFGGTHFADEPATNALVGERERAVSSLLFWSAVAVGGHVFRVVRYDNHLLKETESYKSTKKSESEERVRRTSRCFSIHLQITVHVLYVQYAYKPCREHEQ